MKKVTGKTFSEEHVPLDGHDYEGCTFESCTFVFSATGPWGLNKNRISTDCVFKFTGCASKTLVFMKTIYSMGGWGRNMVLATFEEISPDFKQLH